jgi:hypothetical protein
MADSSLPLSGTERTGVLEPLLAALALTVGSYAIASAESLLTEYLSMTFGLAETTAGAWWLVRTVVAEAPLLVLLLVAMATAAETRDGGLLASCVLPTALLQGMSVGLFGSQSGVLAVLEPSLPLGVATGVVGWLLGMGITATTDRSSDGPRRRLLG